MMGSMRLSANIAKQINKSANSIKGGILCQHNSTSSLEDGIKKKEIKIPTPWGHISGVWWGPEDRQPMLALHGWQDNADTWRPLLPLLPPHIPVLAIDFPGHGLSSWNPPGVFYHTIDNLMVLRRIIKHHFGWQSVSFLGHSMGAIASFLYTACFPKEVHLMIQLDNIKPITGRKENPIHHMANAVDRLLLVDERNISGSEPPSYTYENLLERLHIGSSNSIDKDKCHYLSARAITKSSIYPDKYYFTRDSRLKDLIYLAPSGEDARLMAARISCPVMTIKFKDGPYFEPKENFYEIVDIFKSNNKDFQFHTCPGTHHTHINNPEVVALLINKFLEKYY